MVTSRVSTVKEYLADLPPDRRAALEKVRNVVLANLPKGFEEGMQYGMIGYYVPLSRYPTTYNGQPLGIAALASQKNYMSLYLMSVYAEPELRSWFEEAWAASGKKLDMGKSCVRFKSVDDLPLDVVGEAISRVSLERFVATFEASRTAVRAKAREASKSRGPGKAKSRNAGGSGAG